MESTHVLPVNPASEPSAEPPLTATLDRPAITLTVLLADDAAGVCGVDGACC